MANQDVVNYIKNRLAQGAGDDEIRNELEATGWQEGDIKEAFSVVKPGLPEADSAFSEPSVATRPETTPENEEGAVTPSSLPEDHSKKRFYIAFVVVAIGVLVAAGGVAGYFGGHFDFLKKDSLTAEEIIKKTISAQADIRSAFLEADTEIKIPAFRGAFLPEELLGEITGGINSVKINMNASFELEPSYFKFKKLRYVLDVGLEDSETNQRISAGLEFRTVNGAHYTRLTHLPVFIPGFIRDSLTENWFRIDELIEEEISALDVTSEDISRISEEIKKKIITSFSVREIFNSLERLEDGTIGNDSVYRVHYDINIEKLAETMSSVVVTLEEERLGEFFDLTEEEIGKFKEELTESLRVFESIKGELWIGKDFLLRKLTNEFAIKADDLFGALWNDNAQPEDEPITIKIITNVAMSGHNEPVQVEAPEEYITMDDLMNMFFGPSLEAPLLTIPDEHESFDTGLEDIEAIFEDLNGNFEDIYFESFFEFEGSVLKSVTSWLSEVFGR